MQNEGHKITIGVLALQGGFSLHLAHLKKIGVHAIEVRKKEDLLICNGLILPGGESTTIQRHLNEAHMREALLAFKNPLFGTCAGLIIMAKEGFIPITLTRNAYGRQSASFSTNLNVEFEFKTQTIEGRFIRAPRIAKIDDPEVKVLSQFRGEPVLIQYRDHLGCCFHPELTQDLSIHAYFVQLCRHRL